MERKAGPIWLAEKVPFILPAIYECFSLGPGICDSTHKETSPTLKVLEFLSSFRWWSGSTKRPGVNFRLNISLQQTSKQWILPEKCPMQSFKQKLTKQRNQPYPRKTVSAFNQNKIQILTKPGGVARNQRLFWQSSAGCASVIPWRHGRREWPMTSDQLAAVLNTEMATETVGVYILWSLSLPPTVWWIYASGPVRKQTLDIGTPNARMTHGLTPTDIMGRICPEQIHVSWNISWTEESEYAQPYEHMKQRWKIIWKIPKHKTEMPKDDTSCKFRAVAALQAMRKGKESDKSVHPGTETPHRKVKKIKNIASFDHQPQCSCCDKKSILMFAYLIFCHWQLYLDIPAKFSFHVHVTCFCLRVQFSWLKTRIKITSVALNKHLDLSVSKQQVMQSLTW